MKMKRVQYITASVGEAVGTALIVDPVRRGLCCKAYDPRRLLDALRVHATVALEELSRHCSADESDVIDERLIRALEEIRDASLDVLRVQIILANRSVFQPARFVSCVVHGLLRTEALKVEIARQVRPRLPRRASPGHTRGALTSADGRPRARHGRCRSPQAPPDARPSPFTGAADSQPPQMAHITARQPLSTGGQACSPQGRKVCRHVGRPQGGGGGAPR